jgi:hypothetical protein
MAMIQGIDAGSLIAAFRQGRQDRYSDEESRLKIAGMKADAARKAQVQGIIGQIANGGSGGIAGAYGAPANGGAGGSAAPDAGYAPSQVTPTPEAGTSNLAGAYPTTMGGATAPTAPTAPTAAPATQHPPRQPYDPDLLRKLVVLDPEMGSKIATAFKSMDETDLKLHQQKNDVMGAAAHYLERYPPEQRGQMLQIIAPQLREAGWSDAEIAGANLTDNGLKAYQGVAIDYDKMIDNELAQREFMAGKTTPIAPGGGLAVTKPVIGPDGSVSSKTEFAVIPNTGGNTTGAPASTSHIPAEAQAYLKQHPELRGQFDQKYGTGASASILGGGAGNGTGGFPAP